MFLKWRNNFIKSRSDVLFRLYKQTEMNCYFCDSVNVKYCPVCDKYLCDECRGNYPKRIKEAAKLGIDKLRNLLKK